jgi:hypothetical protein
VDQEYKRVGTPGDKIKKSEKRVASGKNGITTVGSKP